MLTQVAISAETENFQMSESAKSSEDWLDGNLNKVSSIPVYSISDENTSARNIHTAGTHHHGDENTADHDTPIETLQTTSLPPLDFSSDDDETPVVPFISQSTPSHSAIAPVESEPPRTSGTLEEMRHFIEGNLTWEGIDDLKDQPDYSSLVKTGIDSVGASTWKPYILSGTETRWIESDSLAKSNPLSAKSNSRSIILGTRDLTTKSPIAKSVVEGAAAAGSVEGGEHGIEFTAEKDDTRVIEWIRDCQDPTVLNLMDDNGTKVTGTITSTVFG